MSSPAVHRSEYIRDEEKWVGSLGGLICRLTLMRVAVVLPQMANSLDPG